MPVLQGDFSGISSSREPLDGEHRMKLIEIEDQDKDAEWKAKSPGKTPALIFKSEVVSGERAGAQHWDYIYTTTKEGKSNRMGLGQVKAYAEAIVGKERANSTSGIDTDELLQGEFLGVFKLGTSKNQVTGEEKVRSDLHKILPVG